MKALTLPDPQCFPSSYGQIVDVLSVPFRAYWLTAAGGMSLETVCRISHPRTGNTCDPLDGLAYGWRAAYLLPLPDDDQKRQFEAEEPISRRRKCPT